MYFPPVGQLLVNFFRAGERRVDQAAGHEVARGVLRRDAALVSGGAREALAGRVQIREGLRHVDVHPLERRGTYVREVHVRGVDRQRVIDALPGPATGPQGFAKDMVTVTPVGQQFHADRSVRAEQMRLPGLPAAMGATVEGRPTPDGMAFTMRDGLTTGAFTLKVGPARRLADGTTEVTVTEAGHFSLMRERPSSLLGWPAYLFNQLTPMGWMLQATGGAAVSDAHIGLFELEAVLRERLK